MTPKEETDMLKSQADVLKQQLEDIQSRIGTLEKAQAQEKK
jgi:prefoldin subunit 5